MIYVNIFQTSLLLLAARVSASIYPIKPVADTVYFAVQTVSVEWIDYLNNPRLRDMKVSKMDLYLDDEVLIEVFPMAKPHRFSQTFIKTLATDVNASAGVLSVTIPSDIKDKDK
jgi:hypothetical protein